MEGAGRYRRVLGTPGIRYALGAYLLARVASSMVLLALLLHVQRAEGSFVAAGLVTASFAGAVALTAPVLGRLVDRRGQRAVLVPCGLLHPLALLVVVQGSSGGSATPALALGAAALAGATLPPMAACMRALWPSLVDDDDLRTTAFAVESLVVEVCELGGPLLVGALVALVSPGTAVEVAALLSCLGTLAFASTRASRARRVERRHPGAPQRSPLSVAGVRRLVVVVGLSVAAVAALEVSLASFATERGSSAAAGALIGAWVAGSLAAGWAYGARPWRAPLPTQLVVLLLGGALAGLGPLLASGLWTMGALLVVVGLFLAPATAVQFAVLSDLAPDRRRTESFTWASTAAFLGVAGGNLLTGTVVESAGWRVGVATSAGLGLLATACAWRARYSFGLPRPEVWTVPLEVHEQALADADQALAAARTAGARNDELAREISLLRQQLRCHPVSDPVRHAELVVASARRRVDDLASSGVVSLDAALADLRSLEQRRAAVLADIERLRATLLAGATPPATVTTLPRQPSGAETA